MTTRAAADLLGTSRDGPVHLQVETFATLSTPERMLVLSAIPLLASLEPEQLYDVAVIATERGLAAGETLCREGEPGHEVYVVIAGSGDVTRERDGGKVPLGRVATGDCVGELAVLDEAPRAATIEAVEPMRVLAIDGASFRGLLATQPDLSAAVVGMVTRRLRETLARTSVTSTPPGMHVSAAPRG
jgi:CRP-like cAMP-binding protein